MENLAGNKDADLFIREELILAGISITKANHKHPEVPYTIMGRLGDWDLTRAWYYWMAHTVTENGGIPLDIATELHNTPYPIQKKYSKYGDVIRVNGHCGCPPPKEWAFPQENILEKELKRLEIENINYGDLAKLCNEGKIIGERYVRSYHIDTQLGLNEFARIVKSL